MRAIHGGVEPDAADPSLDEPRVLASREVPLPTTPAGRQVVRGNPARMPEPGCHRLSGVFRQLELDRPTCVALHDGCSVRDAALVADVERSKPNEIAATQFAVDSEIEQREVPEISGELQPDSNPPDLTELQGRFPACGLAGMRRSVVVAYMTGSFE
jgi:hypothetical protein